MAEVAVNPDRVWRELFREYERLIIRSDRCLRLGNRYVRWSSDRKFKAALEKQRVDREIAEVEAQRQCKRAWWKPMGGWEIR